MSILRKRLSKGFTTVPNEALRDPRLSYKATGILAVLLSHSDGWNISAASMARGKPDGVTAVLSAYDELIAAGYMHRETIRDGRGRLSTVIEISDTSLTEWGGSPVDGKPDDLAGKSAGFLDQDGPDQALAADREPDDLAGFSAGFPVPDNPMSATDPPLEVTGEKTSEGKKDTDLSTKVDGGLGADIVPIGARVSYAEAGRRILAAWIDATGRDSARAKLNAKRTEKIKARMNEGYSVDDLIAAVRGIALSPFHQGQNDSGKKFDDIHVALRDGEQVEKFRDLFEEGGVSHRKSAAGQVADFYRDRGLL